MSRSIYRDRVRGAVRLQLALVQAEDGENEIRMDLNGLEQRRRCLQESVETILRPRLEKLHQDHEQLQLFGAKIIWVIYVDDPEKPSISVTVEVPSSFTPMGEVFAAARHELFDTEFERYQQYTVVLTV
jgi:hypothetical protein